MAYLLDLIIVGSVSLILRLILIGSRDSNAALYAAVLVILVVHAVYFISLWGNQGQTVGMRAMNLRMVRAEDGGPMDMGRATLRFIPFGVAILLTVFGVLVWLVMAVTTATDPRRQGLHDKLGRTLVLRAR